MVVKYLKHTDIDIVKWDYCIRNSQNSIVYGMSWYLDVVCENWDALIVDDYKAVMPLPWKSKFGIKYIYQPFFTQQLGLFFTDKQYNDINVFIKRIPFTFIKCDISVNYMNKILGARVKKNYILNLNKDYQDLYSSFTTNTKRNIKKSYKNKLEINSNISVDNFIRLSRQNNISRLNNDNFKVLDVLFNVLISKGYAKIVGVYNNEILIGAAFFIEFNNRIIYLFSTSSEQGKDKRVMFAIVNNIINNNINQNKILDFEGSMIESIARFFKGFGAIDVPYYNIKKSKILFHF